ncbi:MAG TPA: response regulator [Legionella sp.]|nr:response regulator [Legionella sp.]
MNNSLRFLITETTLAARIIMRSQLSHSGYAVDMALDSTSTLDLAVTKRYHLIMLDTQINDGLDCYGLIKKLREHSTCNQSTPIILLGQKSAFEEEMNYPCFAKPLNLKDLNKILEYYDLVRNNI